MCYLLFDKGTESFLISLIHYIFTTLVFNKMLFSKTRLLAFMASAMLASATPSRHRRDVVCYFEIPAESGDTCDSLASSWGISLQDFVNINPGVTCPGSLQVGKSYCVIGEYTPGPTSSSSSTTSTTTTQQTSTTSTSSTAPPPEPTNSPQMPGIIPTCDRFYKIQSGDICDTIASRNGITVAQLRSWNSEINASCSNLWVDYYICVHVPGAAPPPTSTTSAPQPSNSPALPGAVNNCNRWYKIISGDSCDTVAAKNTITVAQLRSFNTQINSSMSDASTRSVQNSD